MIHAVPQNATDPSGALARSERFVLWCFRAWACCCRGRRLPAEPVAAALADLGVPEAAEALDAAMTRLVLATARPLAVACPPHPGLSDDERILIAAAAAAQHRDREAVAELFADLLSPPATALVGRALAAFGEAVAAAGVVLPRPASGGTPVRRPSATLH